MYWQEDPQSIMMVHLQQANKTNIAHRFVKNVIILSTMSS